MSRQVAHCRRSLDSPTGRSPSRGPARERRHSLRARHGPARPQARWAHEGARRRPLHHPRMGARATWPPRRVGGQPRLEGTEYVAPVPSAQVKSAILLAGLYAAGETAVVEPVKTRDHTEVMLGAMGAEVKVDGPRVAVSRTERLEPIDVAVPGDFSSAAFWLVAGGLVEAADIRLLGVGVNPTRT